MSAQVQKTNDLEFLTDIVKRAATPPPLAVVQQVNFAVDDLEFRKKGIGGSEAASAIGKNPYKSAVRLWMEKTGRLEPEDLSNNPAVQWGKRSEDMIAMYVEEVLGIPLRRSNLTHYHQKFPFMYGHVDRVLTGKHVIAEIKTMSPFLAKYELGREEGTDEIPEYHLIQAHHYLACLPQMEAVEFFVLVGGRNLRRFHVERDNEFTAMLEEAERKFWQEHVLKDVPPAPQEADDVELLCSHSMPGKTVTASREIETTINLLKALKQQFKLLEEKKENLELYLKEFMQDSEFLVDTQGQALATWKTQSSQRFDSKALKEADSALYYQYFKVSESRVLRLK